MSAANLRAVQQEKSANDNSFVRKLESISSGLKSTPTIISRDLIIEGDILSGGIVEIEGNIKGTVKGNMVILRENGTIQGNVIAESFNIRGNFEGSIKSRAISISSKANVNANIEYNSLSVEDGACIDGQFKYLEDIS